MEEDGKGRERGELKTDKDGDVPEEGRRRESGVGREKGRLLEGTRIGFIR